MFFMALPVPVDWADFLNVVKFHIEDLVWNFTRINPTTGSVGFLAAALSLVAIAVVWLWVSKLLARK